jgi:hypothetical protein
LIYVGVRGAGVHVGQSTENLERFLGLASDAVEAALGPNWRDLGPTDAGDHAARLDTLLQRARTS